MIRRLLRRSKPRHRVDVHDVRPVAGQESEFEPYFVALCDCGWVGNIVTSSEEAFVDAYRHTNDVDETIRRPVG